MLAWYDFILSFRLCNLRLYFTLFIDKLLPKTKYIFEVSSIDETPSNANIAIETSPGKWTAFGLNGK